MSVSEAFKQGFMDKLAGAYKGMSDSELKALASEFVDDTLLPPGYLFNYGPVLRTENPYGDTPIEYTQHVLNNLGDDEKAILKNIFDTDALSVASYNAKARQAAKEFLKRYYNHEPLSKEEFLKYRRRANLPKNEDDVEFKKQNRSLFKRPSTYLAALLGSAPGIAAGVLSKSPAAGGVAGLLGALIGVEAARQHKNNKRIEARSYAKYPDELMYDVVKEQDKRERESDYIDDLYLSDKERNRALKRSAKGLKKLFKQDLSKLPVTVVY